MIEQVQVDLMPSDGLLVFDGFACYPHITKENRKQFFRERIHQAEKNADTSIFMRKDSDDQVCCAVIVEKFPEGSSFFGIGMAHLQMVFFDYVTENQNHMFKLREDIFAEVEEWLNKHQISHVATRIDTGDFNTLIFLQQRGFISMETMVTYVYTKKRPLKPIRTLFRVCDFEPQHKEAILDLCRQSFTDTRFVRDPQLSNERAKAFYEAWGARLAEGGHKGLNLKVALNSADQAIGFVGYSVNAIVKSVTGFVIHGSGLSAVSPKATGAYLALIQETILDETAGSDMGEFKARVEHHHVVRAWQRLGCRQVHTEQTLHWNRRH